MTAENSVKYAGVYINASNIDENLIRTAVRALSKGGKLDVVIDPPPPTLEEAERAIRTLYGYAPAKSTDLDFTVLLNDIHADKWERAFNDAHLEDASRAPSYLGQYEKVALGGTFDRMHWGHRLMLTAAAYSARTTVVIGVTITKLLVNKKFAEALDPYEVRVDSARSFVKYLNPALQVDIYPLDNLYGPTITVKDLGALVVSAETSSGGGQVNAKRAEMGWPVLDVIEIGLIPSNGNDKLSSTDLRREDLKGSL